MVSAVLSVVSSLSSSSFSMISDIRGEIENKKNIQSRLAVFTLKYQLSKTASKIFTFICGIHNIFIYLSSSFYIAKLSVAPASALLSTDLQIILSPLGTWFIIPNPTNKSGKKIGHILSKSVKKCPKSIVKFPNSVQECPNHTKMVELPSKSYSWKKVRDIPSRSYCWSLNLLGTRCPGAATICSSAFL